MDHPVARHPRIRIKVSKTAPDKTARGRLVRTMFADLPRITGHSCILTHRSDFVAANFKGRCGSDLHS